MKDNNDNNGESLKSVNILSSQYFHDDTAYLYNHDANGFSKQVDLDRYHKNRHTYHMMQNWLKVNGRL